MPPRQGSELVAVAFPVNRGEAQLIQGLLENAGIPSIVHQPGVDGPTLGFGLLNPDGGAHQVMVHAHRSAEAQAVLADALAEGEQEAWVEDAHLEEGPGRKPRDYGLIGAYARIYAVSMVAMAAMAGAYLLSRAL